MSFPKKTGTSRLISALLNSARGVKSCFQTEEAFRQEVTLAAILLPAAFWVGENINEILWLVFSVIFVLFAELANTAVERVVDRISAEIHPLSGEAKDIGSAVVMLSLIFCAFVWGTVAIF